VKSIVIVAPNSFRRIHHQSWENQFQVLTGSGEPASLVNLSRLLRQHGKSPIMEQGWRGTNPMAGYYLESYLKRHGYEARTVFDWDNDASLIEAVRCDPMAIAFSTTYVTDNQMLADCLVALRRVIGDLPIIVGGPYIWKQRLQWERDRALTSQEIAEYRAFGVDPESECLFGLSVDDSLKKAIYITHEFGEYTLLQVLQAMQSHRSQLNELPNTVMWNGVGWTMGKELPEPVNLDEDYTRWDMIESMPALVPIRTSVGCPFRCRYCDFIELHPKVIKRSPRSLMDEVHTAHRRGGRFFNLIDDNIFLTKSRIDDLTTTILRHDISMVWGGFFRVDRIDEFNVETLYKSGCRYGMCGIESADEEQLERMQKGCRQNEVRRGIDLATQAGMQLLMTFIIGYPGETQMTIDNTIGFINSLPTHHKGYGSYQVYPFYLLPSTEVDGLEQRREHQIIGRHAIWRHATMTSEQARDMWAPYFLRQVTTLPYEHYATDCPIGWTSTKRNAAFESRRRLTLAFCDGEPDDIIQTRFRQLCHCLAPERQDEVPSWSSILAPRDMQPGRRQARARLGG
jgi:radical SAM superfamily enzyme YgiQ (UPF0313 family)